MKLAVPLGLLGLIAIAVLILIYIFKPKYQDKKFSSTYIWKLSLKYAKRKVPLQWLQSSLLLIVQILILALIALAMATPTVELDTKTGEKIIVLDASASMTVSTGGTSRFDRAKDRIIKAVDETTEEHKISIILADDDAKFLIRRSDSASYAKQKLFEAECTLEQPDIAAAMKLAEGVLAENPAAEVVFYTDTDYGDSGKVKVVNVSSGEWNAAVLDFSAKRDKGRYVFTAKVASYGRAADIPVGLTVDGKELLPKLASCDADGVSEVVWDSLDVGAYDSAEVHLTADDGSAYDNDFYIYSPTAELFKVQLMSDNGGFLYSALRATEKCRIVQPNDTTPAETSGFDLYIYDGYSPDVMPTDGAVWIINPKNDLPASCGLTVGRKNSGDYTLAAASGSQTAKGILQSLRPSGIKVTEYTTITGYEGYESVMTINGDPALLVRNDNGLKTVVLAFDLHYADFPILADFPLLIDNLTKYSMSNTVDKTLYTAGDTVVLNAKADTRLMTVNAKYGDGSADEKSYIEYPVEIEAEKPGVYSVMQTTASGRTIESAFFVRIAEDESADKVQATLVNPVTPYGTGTDTTVKNNTENITFYFIIAILVLLVVEWGLQYREQY